MILFRYKRNGIRYHQIWFNTQQDLSRLELMNVDVLEFRESYESMGLLSPFNNGVISLEDSQDAVYAKFDKGFKYEVRRAEKENLKCSVLEEVNAARLQSIFEDYKAFSDSKNIKAIPLDFLSLYNEAGALSISIAKLEEETLQYHLYFVSEEEHVLLASFPAINSVNMKKTIMGYANRCLHWFDIQKALGSQKKKYNLGGIGNSNSADTMGIVRFKMEMGPETRTYYQGVVPITLKGKCFLRFKKLVGKYV